MNPQSTQNGHIGRESIDYDEIYHHLFPFGHDMERNFPLMHHHLSVKSYYKSVIFSESFRLQTQAFVKVRIHYLNPTSLIY